jgi:hypothetical protein
MRASRRGYRCANFPAYDRTLLPRQQYFRKIFWLKTASQLRARGSVVTSVDSKLARFGRSCKRAHIVCSRIARDADAINFWYCCNGVFRRFRSRERPAPSPSGTQSNMTPARVTPVTVARHIILARSGPGELVEPASEGSGSPRSRFGRVCRRRYPLLNIVLLLLLDLGRSPPAPSGRITQRQNPQATALLERAGRPKRATESAQSSSLPWLTHVVSCTGL